jgi:hypothetical protein
VHGFAFACPDEHHTGWVGRLDENYVDGGCGFEGVHFGYLR